MQKPETAGIQCVRSEENEAIATSVKVPEEVLPNFQKSKGVHQKQDHQKLEHRFSSNEAVCKDPEVPKRHSSKRKEVSYLK